MSNKDKDIATKARHRMGMTDVLLEGLQFGKTKIPYLENVQYRVTEDHIHGPVLREGADGVIRDGVLRVPAGDMSWVSNYESVMLTLYYEGPGYPADVSLVARIKPEGNNNE